MDNAASGKRKAKMTPSPVQGTAQKKRMAEKAGGADGGAGAVRAVAVAGAGADVAKVEAEHRALEAR